MATKQEKLAAIDKKIAALQAQRSKIEAEVEVPVAVVGAAINFLFGRGENRKQYSGVVIAEQGGRIKVQYGEGFDTNIVTIGGGDIVTNKPEPESVPNDAPATSTTSVAGATDTTSTVVEQTAAQQAEAAALAEASANTAETAPASTAPAVASPEALAALGL